MVFDAVFNGLSKALAREEGRNLAKKFGGANETDSVFGAKFDHMWDLTWRARDYVAEFEDAMRAEVNANLNALSAIAAEVAPADGATLGTRRAVATGRDHLRSYRSAPISGRYVVFSDIHITDAGNRQDFFARFNKALYLDVLSSYYAPREFTLVENGDIEELLIFEPDIAGMPNFETAPWQRIFNDRAERQRAQFRRILDDHADFYRVIHDGFIARGAYFRTIGNHDTDLASESYVDDIRDRLGLVWPTASDMLFLTDSEAPQMLICHGHQFDAYCVAAHARNAGESFSQGSGWAYQGPDRYWSTRWDGRDFIDPWRRGDKLFVNMLVSDDPGSPASDANVAEALAGKAIGNLHDPNKWEALYGKNIAWEYFRDSDPQAAFDDEVKTGERWYKFRHMDEIAITASLERQFGRDGMRLLVGHSHEPRFRAGRPVLPGQPPEPVPGYLNSAAAGRFENLIWGVEIEGGEAALVSWSREGDEIQRTLWADFDAGPGRVLRADQTTAHDPTAPVAETPTPPFPLEAITHMLFSTR